MANNFKNPWEQNQWAQGGEEYKKSAVGTEFLPEGFLDTTMSLQEYLKSKKSSEVGLNSASTSSSYKQMLVCSTTTDIEMRREGEKGFDRNNMMPLFSVLVDPYYLDEDDNLKPSYKVFLNKFTITQGNVFGEINQRPNNRFPTKVETVIPVAMDLELMVEIKISALERLRQEAVKTIKGSFKPIAFDKVKYFDHKAKFDVKHALLKDRAFVFIEEVGLFESDFIGNLFYGAVMANFQHLDNTLNDGDLLQSTGVDDPLDSFGIIVGYIYGKNGITKNTFNNIKSVSLYKRTVKEGMYYHYYEIDDKKEGKFTLKTTNY